MYMYSLFGNYRPIPFGQLIKKQMVDFLIFFYKCVHIFSKTMQFKEILEFSNNNKLFNLLGIV